MRNVDYILGIPVLCDAESGRIADARGIGSCKRIVVGPRFFQLAPREQYAVLLHEAWHCIAYHFEKRLLLLPIFWTKRAARIAQEQELAADDFAAQHGFARDLLDVVRRTYRGRDDEFYPTYHERCNRLITASREALHVAA